MIGEAAFTKFDACPWSLIFAGASLAERGPALDRSSAVAVTVSIRYDDARLVCILCISRQSLYR